MSAGRKINCVQIQFFVQWRRNSGIVEAIAEHDSRPKGFLGMICAMESTGLLFYVAPILLCWLCPSGCSMFKKVVGLLLWGITCIFKKNENSVKKSSDIKMNEN